MAWKKSLHSWLHESAEEAPRQQLETLRFQVQDALYRCEGAMCERMRWRIEEACTAQQLWLLRGEIFQLVARQFCQEEAVRRINALLPAFSGWLPERMLTRV